MKDVVIFKFETKTKEYILRADKDDLNKFYQKEEEFGDASDEALQVICDLIKSRERIDLTPDDIIDFGEYLDDDFVYMDIRRVELLKYPKLTWEDLITKKEGVDYGDKNE